MKCHEVLYKPQAHFGALDLVSPERDPAVPQHPCLGLGLSPGLLRNLTAGVVPRDRGRGNGYGRGCGCRRPLGVRGRPGLVLVRHQAAAEVVADVGELLGDGGQQYRVLLAGVAYLAREYLVAGADAAAKAEEQAVEVVCGLGLVAEAVAAEPLEDGGESGEALAADA